MAFLRDLVRRRREEEGKTARPDVDELEARRDEKGLIKALGYEDDWNVRANASWVLGELRSRRAVDALIEALKDEHEGVRARAAGALGKIGSRKAQAPLTNALGDEDKVTVVWALFGLYKLGDKSRINELIAALEEEDEVVRAAAALTLGEIGDLRAIEPLTAACETAGGSLMTMQKAIERIRGS